MMQKCSHIDPLFLLLEMNKPEKGDSAIMSSSPRQPARRSTLRTVQQDAIQLLFSQKVSRQLLNMPGAASSGRPLTAGCIAAGAVEAEPPARPGRDHLQVKNRNHDHCYSSGAALSWVSSTRLLLSASTSCSSSSSTVSCSALNSPHA